MSPDAIELLRQEHQRIRTLFVRFQHAQGGEGRAVRGDPREIVEDVLEQLTVHTFVENEVMYPRVRELAPELAPDVLEFYEEHHLADLLCAELAGLSADDERFAAKWVVLVDAVTHHLDDEEQRWFPRVRTVLGLPQLQQIGVELVRARARAPRRPVVRGVPPRTVDAGQH